MTNEEFIIKAKAILSRHGIYADICSDKDTLYLGSFSYFTRQQMVETAKEILILDGYTLAQEIHKGGK